MFSLSFCQAITNGFNMKSKKTQGHMFVGTNLLEVGVLAAKAKYPSVLARSAHLQIFATKNIVFYNCKFFAPKTSFLRQKMYFFYTCMKTGIFTVLHSSQMILVFIMILTS